MNKKTTEASRVDGERDVKDQSSWTINVYDKNQVQDKTKRFLPPDDELGLYINCNVKGGDLVLAQPSQYVIFREGGIVPLIVPKLSQSPYPSDGSFLRESINSEFVGIGSNAIVTCFWSENQAFHGDSKDNKATKICSVRDLSASVDREKLIGCDDWRLDFIGSKASKARSPGQNSIHSLAAERLPGDKQAIKIFPGKKLALSADKEGMQRNAGLNLNDFVDIRSSGAHCLYENQVCNGASQATDAEKLNNLTSSVFAGNAKIVDNGAWDITADLKSAFHREVAVFKDTDAQHDMAVATLAPDVNTERMSFHVVEKSAGNFDMDRSGKRGKYTSAGIDCILRFLLANVIDNNGIRHFFENMKHMVGRSNANIQVTFSTAKPGQRPSHSCIKALNNQSFFQTSRIQWDSNYVVTREYIDGDGTGLLQNANSDGAVLKLRIDDPATAIEPTYRYSEMQSQGTIIGDNGLFERAISPQFQNVPDDGVSVKTLALLTPAYLKSLFMNYEPRAFPNVLTLTGKISKQGHSDAITYCETLRNSGDFEMHSLFIDKHIENSNQGNTDVIASFLLEKSLAMINQNELTAADECLEKLTNIAEKAENSSLLLGRSFVSKANVALRQGDYEKVLNELEKASHHMCYFASGDEKTFLCYLFGVAYMNLASQFERPNVYLEEQALAYFDLYLQHAKIQENGGFFVQRGINYVMFQMASIYLRTYCERMKMFPVDEVAIESAKNCLRVVENAKVGLDEHATAIKIVSIKSDIAYREGQIQLAKDIIDVAEDLSKRASFTPFIVKKALSERKTFFENINES